MIVVPGRLDPPADRLLAALTARGLIPTLASEAPAGGDAEVTLTVSSGPAAFDFAAFATAFAERPCRVLVLSRLGAHPDAKTPALRRLWRLEEHVRACGLPTLTLRFGPLVGPGAPLWERLRRRPALPRGGRMWLNPVLEEDAVETLVRALADPAPWRGLFAVAGASILSLAELRDLAAAHGPGPDRGAWTPPLEELAEHGITDGGDWQARFGLGVRPLAERLAARAA